MTADSNRKVFVGQEGVKQQGLAVEIVTVSPNGRMVKLKGKQHWIDVDTLTFSDDPLFNSPGDESPDNELYPIGTVLSNGAGETVKVGGALATDFQPYLWLPGQRARLLQDLPDEAWPLLEDDEGTVTESAGELGFKSDRYGSTSMTRKLDGKTVRVLDYCEAIVADSLTPKAADEPGVDETEPEDAGDGDSGATNEDTQALLEQIQYLEKRIESLLFDNSLLNKEHDKYMQSLEKTYKLTDALEAAEKQILKLKAANEQQSDMLRETITPIPQPLPQGIREGGQMRLKTLMSTGGSNGFAEVCIPHGWEIAAITTEFYAPNGTPQLVRMVHIIGCDSPATPLEETEEKVTVEFPPLANSFEDFLRGEALMVEAHNSELQPSLLEKLKTDKPIFAAIAEYGLEAVKESLDDQVLSAARVAYENALEGTDWQPKRFERLLTTGNVNSDEVTHENDVLLEVLS